MTQPLVTRPPYGNQTASSGLPEGGHLDKGRPLDGDIPGTKTFVKPLDDDDSSKTPGEDESIHRIDNPRDIPKSQTTPDEIDHSKATPSYYGVGPKDPNDYSKTKYPYRNDKSDTKNASADLVAQLYILEQKQPIYLSAVELTQSRVASTAEQILAGLNPKFVSRASDVVATLRRADIKNLRWIFSIQGSKGLHYAVKIKGIRPRKNTTAFSKLDLELSCSCPAWQWQGPEYHAKDEYQLGKQVGTASTPDIRDPRRINKVCKHVAAVLAQTRSWNIPAEK